jgi:hypothetical protein
MHLGASVGETPMIVTYGNLTIAVDLAPGQAGMWWFSFQVPNYAGKGKTEIFRGKRGYPNRTTARKHATDEVHAEVVRHFEALGRWDIAAT